MTLGARPEPGAWELGFPWALVIGHWNLSPRLPPLSFSVPLVASKYTEDGGSASHKSPIEIENRKSGAGVPHEKRGAFPNWNLELGISLVIGIWTLELPERGALLLPQFVPESALSRRSGRKRSRKSRLEAKDAEGESIRGAVMLGNRRWRKEGPASV